MASRSGDRCYVGSFGTLQGTQRCASAIVSVSPEGARRTSAQRAQPTQLQQFVSQAHLGVEVAHNLADLALLLVLLPAGVVTGGLTAVTATTFLVS